MVGKVVINVRTFIQGESSIPAVVVVVVMALDVYGHFLHVVVMDSVHLIWHVYDVVFAATSSVEQQSIGLNVYLYTVMEA
jgi:hypothetical protein